jgi:hypothetical protein
MSDVIGISDYDVIEISDDVIENSDDSDEPPGKSSTQSDDNHFVLRWQSHSSQTSDNCCSN